LENHLSILIIDETLRFVENDSRYEVSVKAIASGILTTTLL
jgi:hypothetical protein